MTIESEKPKKRYTILGAGGAIGNCLAEHLLQQNKSVRLVSRTGYSMPNAEVVKADLTSFPETIKAVKNSDVVFLCAGLPYNSEIWEEQWPRIMNHVIEACIKENALLLFFDNVYMYGKVTGKMTESTPYNPCSRKGELRAKIAMQLEEEMAGRNIRAVVARAADLYGPYSVQNSLLYQLIIKNLMRGKKAQWMGSLEEPHTFTYTRDCAVALQLLVDTSKSWNQVWHLPSFNPGLTGQQWIELLAQKSNAAAQSFLLPNWMLKLSGFFSRTIAETHEMLYQLDSAYHFDSTKFNQYFNFKPTSYVEGVRETLNFLQVTKS